MPEAVQKHPCILFPQQRPVKRIKPLDPTGVICPARITGRRAPPDTLPQRADKAVSAVPFKVPDSCPAANPLDKETYDMRSTAASNSNTAVRCRPCSTGIHTLYRCPAHHTGTRCRIPLMCACWRRAVPVHPLPTPDCILAFPLPYTFRSALGQSDRSSIKYLATSADTLPDICQIPPHLFFRTVARRKPAAFVPAAHIAQTRPQEQRDCSSRNRTASLKSI